MDDNNNIKLSRPVPPFLRYCSAIIPTAFDDSLSYYEALCALYKWLQTNVIDTINHNASVTNDFINKEKELEELFAQLKEYVDNYFDNLDVQEEINNKLDNMVEAGTLQEIIAAYLNANAVWGFDNVADMKNSTNLIDGSYAKTLGYHDVNDGGNATYKIREITNSDVVDESFIIALSNNTLVAELVIDGGEVNAKQLGCYADGTHDDTAIIQNAITRLKQEVTVDSDLFNSKTLCFNGGKYKITDTIVLTPLVKIKATAQTSILSYVSGEPLFYLDPTSTDKIEELGLDQIMYFGELIDGSAGLYIYNANENNDSIALKLGTESDSRVYRVAHALIKNLSIRGFNIGIMLTMHNIYCDTFDNVSITQCNTDVKVGKSDDTGFNSGERITFNCCQFGASRSNNACIDFYQTGYLYFNNCSFDYARCFFKDSSAEKSMISINIDNCHLEGANEEVTDMTLPHGIIYGYFRYGNISISNSVIAITNKYPLFSIGSAGSKPQHSKYTLSIENTQFVSGTSNNTDVQYQYMATDTLNIVVKNVDLGKLNNEGKMINEITNIVRENHFNNESVGSITLNHYNTSIGTNVVKYVEDISYSASIATNSVNGEKCLKMTSSGSNPRLSILTDYLDCDEYKTIFASSWTQGFYKQRIQFNFYDESKTLISSSSTTNTTNIRHDIATPYAYSGFKKEYTPKGTKYVTIQYFWENGDPNYTFADGTELIVGEMKAFVS